MKKSKVKIKKSPKKMKGGGDIVGDIVGGGTSDISGGGIPYGMIGNTGAFLADQLIDTEETTGKGLTGKTALKEGLRYGGQGAAIGANPALMAATGGLSLPIGAALGITAGATKGIIDAEKEKKQIKEKYDQIGYRPMENQQSFFQQGGLIPKSLIEVEGPELEVDEKTGKILKDFKGVPSHKNGGYTYMAEKGRIIIRGKDADKYKSSDNFARKSMIREHIMTQKNNEDITNTYKNGGKVNFKSKGDYKKWLGYIHATGLAESTPGNKKVSIRGKSHKVKHMGGGGDPVIKGSGDSFTENYFNTDENGNIISQDQLYKQVDPLKSNNPFGNSMVDIKGSNNFSTPQTGNPFGNSLVNIQGSGKFSTPEMGNTYTNVNWGNIATEAATWAPTLFNLVSSFQKPIEEKGIYNPNEQQSLDIMKKRSINLDPIKNDIYSQEKIASAPTGESQGSYLSRRTQVAANTQKALTDANIKAQAANLGYQGEYAQSLDNFGRQRASADERARDLTIMNKRNVAQFFPKALEDTSKIEQLKDRESQYLDAVKEIRNQREKLYTLESSPNLSDEGKKRIQKEHDKLDAEEEALKRGRIQNHNYTPSIYF